MMPTRYPPKHGRPLASRVLLTEDGTEWRATEVDASHVPGARGARCLIIEGPSLTRRVWDYPDDWQQLPVAELLALPPRRTQE